jgi:uncharacterized iron-regulated protein
MRFILPLMILTLSAGLAWARDYSFVRTSNGKPITLEKLAKQLKKYDVVFFGEFHDDPNVHLAQRELLPELYKNNKKLILSFEMFERDVQPLLDGYLKGELAEDAFLAGSRPWGNYETDYRPLVEFAKAHGLKAIAANVPRRLAGKAARSGVSFAAELPEEDKLLMALEVNNPSSAYKERFLATMLGMGNHGDAGDGQLYENMYLAQCLKDDTMAESIVRYRELYPKHKIIHFNGDFHSREFLGTVERVLLRSPRLKVAVITPAYALDLPPGVDKVATYLLLVPPPEPAEP